METIGRIAMTIGAGLLLELEYIAVLIDVTLPHPTSAENIAAITASTVSSKFVHYQA